MNSKIISQESDWKLIKEWIGKVNIRLDLLTRASEDGFKGSTFIDKCGDKGPFLVVIKANDYIFGGYCSISWPKTYNTYL
jgi:hypothetical protein